jgi:hypothetical protein
MTDEEKLEIINILEETKGDDLYRFQRKFYGMTPTEMQGEFGQSGKTFQQVLDGAKAHVQHINDLQEAVRRT